ncbi:uncharacterized protein LOC116352611 [Contarinia nasturtii]|uniref:uncharacterized protein LOC116352611 n=1 Tax=Contarinia nasturtii TaxID=265458 RepID=UPI0012D404AD|nr:uncharacterized protein LOC116352611 [Contarinia nasturtii]
MESELEETFSFVEFEEELKTAAQNINLFDQVISSIVSGENELQNDKSKFQTMKTTMKNFHDILKNFNSDVDIVFAHFDEQATSLEECHTQKEFANNKCQITHIVDAQQFICYVIDINGEIFSQLKHFWKQSMVQEVDSNGSSSLGLNDIFGIKIDSKVHRAKFIFDSLTAALRIRLIDTGEMIDLEDYNFQKLPADIKSLPPCAFLCKINQIGSEKMESLCDSLKGQIFEYRICKTAESNSQMLHIDIYSTNPFLAGFNENMDSNSLDDVDSGELVNGLDVVKNDVGSNLEQTINETLKWKWNMATEVQSKKSVHIPNPINNSNYDLNDNTSNDIQLNEFRNAFATSHRNNTTTHNDEYNDDANGAAGGVAGSALDTEQQPLRIDEKSISIKNRLNDFASNIHSVVVANKRQTNIINVPSQPYCSVSDWRDWQQKQQSPGSKSSLTFKSVRPMKTQCETTYYFQSHHSHLKVPNVGDQTTILPTFVLNANEFYGQLGREFNGLQYFEQQLNVRRAHYEYKQYTQIPEKSELVLVLLENGFFYRARVLDCVQQRITVFLLDYGTTHIVLMRNIYKWTNICDKFPFQSVLFTFTNVSNQNCTESELVNYVKEKLPQTFFLAEVAKINDRSIYVRLFDDCGYDIGEEINCFSASIQG